MGQSVSTPKPHPDLVDFLNLPKEALDSLWTSYNLLGEGWGLNVDEMISIFKGAEFVASNYKYTDIQLKNLFKAFDTDGNGLVDALELFVTIALTSGGQICFVLCALFPFFFLNVLFYLHYFSTFNRHGYSGQNLFCLQCV